MGKTFLFLAEGFEDIEAIAVVDVLRRGGVEVRTVSVSEHRQVKSAHGVTVTADLVLGEPLLGMMQQQYDKGGYIAAICAAPALVFGHLQTRRRLCVTCYPGFEKYLPADFEILTDGVVADGRVITGKGPGFAVKFGLILLEHLRSAEVAQEVAAGMLCI